VAQDARRALLAEVVAMVRDEPILGVTHKHVATAIEARFGEKGE